MDNISTDVYKIIVTVLLTFLGTAITLLIKLFMQFNKLTAKKIDDLEKRTRITEDNELKIKNAFNVLGVYHANNHEEKIDFDKLLDYEKLNH